MKGLYLASSSGEVRGYVPHSSNLLIQSGDQTLLTPGGRFAPPPAVIRGTDATASPDGSHVAYARGGTLYVAAIDGSGERVVVTGVEPPPSYVVGPAWSPDGTRIAIASAGALVLVQTDGSGQRKLADKDYSTRLNDNDNPSWSPDGTIVAFEHNTGSHWEIAWLSPGCIQCGRTIRDATSANDRFPQFSPVSDTLAYISDRQRLRGGATTYQYALYTEVIYTNVVHKLVDDVHPYSPPRWSPTAALIAVAAGQECRRAHTEVSSPTWRAAARPTTAECSTGASQSATRDASVHVG